MIQTRREFLTGVASGAVLFAVGSRARAEQVTQSFAGPMLESAYRPVKLAAKAGATPSMSNAQRDDLEHQIHCQCGCSLDVYTCRTTDFSCTVSPAMHADVMGLVDGGYSAAEILSAFQKVYGERVLMAPIKSGFNWLGYVTPSVAIAAGAVVILGVIRKWRQTAAGRPAPIPLATDATPAEIEAINAAMRDDG